MKNRKPALITHHSLLTNLTVYRLLFTTILLCLTFASNAQSRPNIIFILADDLGIGDVGCYGQQKILTPNIDKMAKAGMRFTQMYAGTSVCAPSRASFMTGLHTGHTPVRGNMGFKPEGQYPLPEGTITVASVLKNAGYTTGDFGKWGLGYPGSTGVPNKQGFDIFYGYNCQSLAHNYYPDHLWQNDQKIELPENKLKDSVYSADLIHQHALDFLQQQNNKPFFLFLSYTLPHAALSVPHDSMYDFYVKKFNDQPLGKNDKNVKRYEKAAFEPYPHAAYAAMVSRLDKYVGDVITALEKQGKLENTLIIFSSDNGPHKEGGNDPEFFNSNGIYKGIKRDLYEGGMREPFIVMWKGKIKPGTTNDHIGAFWDLFPTFQELAGLKPSTNIDGISMVPTLTGKDKQQKQHDYLYWEFQEEGGKQAVRLGNWKGIKLNVTEKENPALELYDLTNDVEETKDIAAQHPDIVKRIDSIMQQAHIYNKDWQLLKKEKL